MDIDLPQCFLHTLSPAPELRREAERYLSESSDRPGYGIRVLLLLNEPSVDEPIRHAASIHFKNHVRFRWVPPAASDPAILDAEKDQIKTLIVHLMVASSSRIQIQLREALAVIGKHDFPQSWPYLLPDLVCRLRQASDYVDYTSINGILGTANSIFKKFRYEYKTNDLRLDLKYCLDGFAAPLLAIFLKTSKLISANLYSAEVFESQRLCCRIFYSLNFQELQEIFDDHTKEWMSEFKSYLNTPYSCLENDRNGLQAVDGLRAAVCDNISLYIKKSEEKINDNIRGFANAISKLLEDISVGPARDHLAITAIKSLTTVSTSVHHSIFSNPGILQRICDSIIIPNILLRDEDEELFEFNYVEYIRRDIEVSDLETRRGIACALIKGISTNYKDQITQIVSRQIENMLSLYGQNQTSNWKQKDCVVYLVSSLSTKKAGGSSVSTDLVNVESFFISVILPELQSSDVNALPMLKADALKFFTTFRNIISKPVVLASIPNVVRYLGSESNVVHSYAANCIEKLLLVKEEGHPQYAASDISPFLSMLLTNLFNALKFPESQENFYVMKCIMRVFGVADIGGEVAGACIDGLTAILGEICQNPRNPLINHYLFEALAALIRRSCERDPSLISSFETRLFPVLDNILVNDVSEFWPYTFQIFAQLVELNRPPLSVNMQLYTVLLNLLARERCNRSGNVPALVRLLQAYLQKVPPHELNQEGRLTQVLGIFRNLVSTSSTDELGFSVLNTVIENLSYEVITPYVSGIWTTLFMQLQIQPTVTFLKSFLIFMSLFLIKYGHGPLVDSINAVQPNLFGEILEKFWIPNLNLITGFVELKLISVASTILIGESPILLDNSSWGKWGKMLDSIITLLSRPEQDRVEEEPEVPDIGETLTAKFVHLYHAGKKEEDPLKEVRDPKEFLLNTLAKVSAAAPGKYPAIIKEIVDPANQSALLQLCSAYNCSIV